MHTCTYRPSPPPPCHSVNVGQHEIEFYDADFIENVYWYCGSTPDRFVPGSFYCCGLFLGVCVGVGKTKVWGGGVTVPY